MIYSTAVDHIEIHDTMSGTPIRLHDKNIKIYLCGVTTYDDTHIGHARTIIVFDVLRRYLEDTGRHTTMVQNFTDIDDKIIQRAEAEGTDALKLSFSYIERYHRDFDRLNVKRADMYPQATTHIQDIIDIISKLIELKHAYVVKSGVYYMVESFSEYGALSKKNIKELRAGTRIDPKEDKHDTVDFALWKRTDSKPCWESPWGAGRPGWHIECSAMSLKHLGETFDIHGGGRDLIFPHHENEIAQTKACTKLPLARAWMHVGMVTISGQKMSKSLGNIKTTRNILDEWGPNTLRLFCLSGHYQKPIDYTEELLVESLDLWRRIESCYYTLEQTAGRHDKVVCDEFDQALSSNFNTHKAITVLGSITKEAGDMATRGRLNPDNSSVLYGKLARIIEIFGLKISRPSDARQIQSYTVQRGSLRQSGDYRQADIIRDKLNAKNIELLDYKNGTIWVCHENIQKKAAPYSKQ